VPRAGLNPALVVDEAARLADEIGLERLTLAALAARFGVAVPSLYKHVGGLDAVRRGVAIRGVRDLGEALDAALAAAPGTPSARLRALAVSYRGFARAHPGRYAASVRAAAPDDAEHVAASNVVLRLVLDVLGERGLGGDDAIDAARGLRAALHGFVALESAGGFGLPRDVDRSFERLVDVLDAGLTGARVGAV
jgi:AcrR family transcriptional regulator